MVKIPPKLLPHSKTTVIAYVATLAGIGLSAYYLNRPSSAPVAPSYDIVLPQRTPVDELGGWKRVSPSGSDPVFAYDDTIEDIDISVSQQPLPASFAENTAASVKQLAESYSATTVIEAGGTEAYIGRSARGPQSVIFAKDNTLVLIKSQKTISQEDWIRYINNLVNPKTEQLPSF